MSYSIIFETKIVKLSDGRIIRFDLSGCNNDNSGRSRDDFNATLYRIEDFIKESEDYKIDSIPYKPEHGDYWQLKIGNRYCNMYDYGEHLLRMLNRAIPYSEFISNRDITIDVLTGYEITRPQKRIVTPTEFDELFYEYAFNGGIRYRELLESVDVRDEKKVVELLEAKKPLRIYIARPKKAAA